MIKEGYNWLGKKLAVDSSKNYEHIARMSVNARVLLENVNIMQIEDGIFIHAKQNAMYVLSNWNWDTCTEMIPNGAYMHVAVIVKMVKNFNIKIID